MASNHNARVFAVLFTLEPREIHARRAGEWFAAVPIELIQRSSTGRLAKDFFSMAPVASYDLQFS